MRCNILTTFDLICNALVLWECHKCCIATLQELSELIVIAINGAAHSIKTFSQGPSLLILGVGKSNRNSNK